MLVGEPPRPPEDGVPPSLLPPDLDLQADDLLLVSQIWYGESRMAHDHAIRAHGIAQLARHRRTENDAVFGRKAGPGMDALAWRNQAMADVSEGFVPELAQILACTESEAETA